MPAACTPNYMANTKRPDVRRLFFINPAKAGIIGLVVLFSGQPGAADLNNYTKTFTPAGQMSSKDWNDEAELQRVWQAALVRIPQGEGRYLTAIMNKLNQKNTRQSVRHPTVIYLHGCGGVWQGTHTRINLLASHGYAVIAPVSFARKKYPKSCDPQTRQGGLYRDTLKMRQYDAEHAVRQARSLTWVDADNLFLMGFSQGGIAVATLSPTLTPLRGRIVEGWTCHAGWDEYRGVNAPASEPVLTLVGISDPWFQNEWTKGECSHWLNRHNGSKSIVYTDGSPDNRHGKGVRVTITDPHLSRQHSMLQSEKVQKTVLQFLRSHTR